MSTPATLPYDFLVSCATHCIVADPGDGGTFSFPNNGLALLPIVGSGTETRTIPAPTTVGQMVYGWMDTGSDLITITVTGGATNLTTVTLTEVGVAFFLRAVSIAGVAKWQVIPTGRAAALVTPLTTITIADAEGPPDYAMASYTNTSAWGFASEQEMITFTYVVKNLQERLVELEAALQIAGLRT